VRKDAVEKATVARAADEAAECRRLAELLDLDVVGIVRTRDGRTRTAWWSAPDAAPLPLELGDVLEGRARDWIACPNGDDVVFVHLTPTSPVRSVRTLAAMLSKQVAADGAHPDRGGVAPEDPVARERARLAYAIHDGLTQIVTASVLELEWLARRTDLDPAQATAALEEAAAQLRAALEEIRGILNGLSPQDPGTAEPLEELLEGVMRRWQLPTSWTIDGDLHAVPTPVLEAASSVIRESVANAAKHSASKDVAVSVHATRDAMEVKVEDDGRGFEPSGTGLAIGHLGLEMMRRRVAEVHGTLDIESSPGQGTRVVARLPVGQGDEP
jgi:signal transduction histidine kinase